MKRSHADALKTIYLGPVFHSARQLVSQAWLGIKGVPKAGPKKKDKPRRKRDLDGVWSNLVSVQHDSCQVKQIAYSHGASHKTFHVYKPVEQRFDDRDRLKWEYLVVT
ncbi:hypothetical protein CERZMDRAFT_102371 [Cercospora zeae-maydis SCOH1-5]|uniref:Uncharacterized protein n=1 Tax=Cercospora zeae-maydis SCOH1-5 TaxID=717836 RepID=A0A6A6F2E4_9PEZI|nr:hypothetical protein CERZMDRAFT_102371 [Cercospora zeae-maydis SCOH1-5]